MLTNPPKVSSTNGTLQTTLTLQAGTHATGSSLQMTTRLLNGTLPGPTLRMQPGDTLEILFQNNLQDQGLGYVHNEFSAPDESNIHFHGLHVSGELPSDDVTHVVGPGESYTYQTTLPEDHMPGTHWLHPHRHGSTSLHVGGGAILALIVQDPPNTLPPQVENAPEVLFIAQMINVQELQTIARASQDNLFSISGAPSNEFVLVNGQYQPTISLNPGEWVRFRIIWSMWYEGLMDFNIPGCEMQLLAKDGIYIRDFPRSLKIAPIAPGGRADIMVRCLEPSSTYSVNGLGGGIATIQTTDSPVISSENLASWEPTYPEYLTDLRSSSASPGCSCATELDDDTVNGISFVDKNAILHSSYLGAIVEREVEADEHPYHQHVYPYQLTSGFGGYDKVGDWHDTVTGEGVIRYSPTQFTGKIMVHCHLLIHEDEGAMAIEKVGTDAVCTCTSLPVVGMGGIIGIAVGSVLLVALIAYCIYRRGKRSAMANENAEQVAEESALAVEVNKTYND